MARNYKPESSLMKSTLLASELRKLSYSDILAFADFSIFFVLSQFIDRSISTTTSPIALGRNRCWIEFSEEPVDEFPEHQGR